MRRSVDEYGQIDRRVITHDPNSAPSPTTLFLADGRIVDEMANPTAEKVLDLMKKQADGAMRKATLKGLLAHKFRLAATALAIVLGVSFVAGTYVLTDTITASFDSLFKQVTQGIDVAVRSEETFGGFDTGEVRDPMPAALLERIQAVDGVRVAEGNVTGYAQLVGKDGKAVTTSGAPSPGVSFNQDQPGRRRQSAPGGSRAGRTSWPSTPRRPRTPATRSATGSRCCSRARPVTSRSAA